MMMGTVLNILDNALWNFTYLEVKFLKKDKFIRNQILKWSKIIHIKKLINYYLHKYEESPNNFYYPFFNNGNFSMNDFYYSYINDGNFPIMCRIEINMDFSDHISMIYILGDKQSIELTINKNDQESLNYLINKAEKMAKALGHKIISEDLQLLV